MEDNITNKILELHKAKNWRDIVSSYHDHPERNKVLWVFPSEDNLKFLQTALKQLKCYDLISIGCGSGLLEWIISVATGIPVKGVEVDGVWWKCKYAPPSFIPLLFTPSTLDQDTINLLQNCDTTALMFCYFNNRKAFDEYLRYFTGSVIIIIGPGEGKGIHTDPLPFGDVSGDWSLHEWQQVRNSIDYIAIYKRSTYHLNNKVNDSID